MLMCRRIRRADFIPGHFTVYGFYCRFLPGLFLSRGNSIKVLRSEGVGLVPFPSRYESSDGIYYFLNERIAKVFDDAAPKRLNL
jgi:hypothetical protein